MGVVTVFHIIFVGIFSLIVFIAGTPCSAENITYRDMIKAALNNSARVRVKVEDIHISDAVYRQSFAGLYPVISANSRLERYENLDKRAQQGISSISGEVVGGDPSAWRSSFYLQGEYYISNWYKKRFEALYYEKLKGARIHDCEVETKKLLRELTDVYDALAESKIKWRYGSMTLQRFKDIFHLKKEVFSKGQISYEEVIKAEADAVNADKELAGVRKEMKENLERLYSYTGNTYGEDMEIEMFTSTGGKQFMEINKTIEATPEYKARMKELEAIKDRAKAAANNFWPDVSLYGRYDYYGSDTNSLDYSARDVRETSYRAGLMISFPLFDGGAKKWERAKSNYEIRKQEESVKAVAEEKGRDIKTLSAGYAELSKAHRHYKKLADQYGKMLEIAKKSQDLGERSIIDILEIEKDALVIERDLKVTEQTIAAYEKRLFLETDFNHFMVEHYGDGACKY